ncbi:MAG: DnaJ domain-containing protein [Devosia sp.]|nr:DnaJ domain-containing protein [Devosia sp.]
MTDFDPYRVLGVGRAAEQGAIKAAYRLKVRGAHPDRGGDPNEFIAIVKAFGLLSDPELRQVFDETGIVDLESLRSHRHDVTTVLADMFDAAVQSAVGSGLKLSTVDFIELMTTAVAKGVADARRQSDQIGAEIEALAALTRRIRRNDQRQNLFVERLNAQMQAKTQDHAAMRRRLLILETAGVELGNYESDVELISALEAAP